jgi:hypothetical protein
MAIDMSQQNFNSQSNFLFRSAELNLESYVDPFLKGAAVITGTAGNVPTVSGGTPTVDVEEAWLQTTSLPGNLRVTGGRVFADFGRLEHFHDHELPVINRPLSIDSLVGGETRADGLEVNYLFPTDTFIEAVAGAYDKMGAENDRVDPTVTRKMAEFTYLGRVHTSADLGDNGSFDLGVSDAWTPERAFDDGTGFVSAHDHSFRQLSGMDLTFRWHPVKGGLYHGLIWSTEVLRNDELRVDPVTSLAIGRRVAWGGFSYVEYKATRRLHPGVMVDLAEDPDSASKVTRTYTGYLSFDVTEFQRIRLQYSGIDNNQPGSSFVNFVGLQWTGVFGHHVHGFRDR